jgi:hypothetical protein
MQVEVMGRKTALGTAAIARSGSSAPSMRGIAPLCNWQLAAGEVSKPPRGPRGLHPTRK